MLPDNPESYPKNSFIKSPKTLYSKLDTNLTKSPLSDRVAQALREKYNFEANSLYKRLEMEASDKANFIIALDYLCRPKHIEHVT